MTGGGSPAASIFAPFFRKFYAKDEVKNMKYKIFTVTALTGGVVAELFGG